MTHPTALPADAPAAVLQHAFAALLPRVVAHARVRFRRVRCPHARDEAVAETVALAWAWFVRLARRGKHPQAFVSALAGYAARAVASGRRVCGQEPARDVLSPRAVARHRFAAGPLPDGGPGPGNPLAEALADNTRSPVPDQVSFRVDFPAWLATRSPRDRVLIGELMAGERARDVSRRHRVSPGRISQLRRAYHASWRAFGGGADAGGVVRPS